jgi:hypothetical protein
VLPEKISSEHASLVHDADYIDRFFNGKTSAQEQRMTGFPWSAELVDRTRYETGWKNDYISDSKGCQILNLFYTSFVCVCVFVFLMFSLYLVLNSHSSKYATKYH